jgi:hypothetical protein
MENSANYVTISIDEYRKMIEEATEYRTRRAIALKRLDAVDKGGSGLLYAREVRELFGLPEYSAEAFE